MIRKHKKGTWQALGIHGGKEGKYWQKGKRSVSLATVQVEKIKGKYIDKVDRMRFLNDSDKRKLIRQIEKL